MKITAFILSVLLSTTALAENYAGQYSGVIESIELERNQKLGYNTKHFIISSINDFKAEHQNSGLEYSNECLICVAKHNLQKGKISVLSMMIGALAGFIVALMKLQAMGALIGGSSVFTTTVVATATAAGPVSAIVVPILISLSGLIGGLLVGQGIIAFLENDRPCAKICFIEEQQQ